MKEGNRVIYTANIGVKDSVKPIYPADNYEVICFTDTELSGDIWEFREPKLSFNIPRKTARWHKLHPFYLFPDAEYVIWMDASQELVVHPDKLIAKLGDNDIASFAHPDRDCLYDEAETCLMLDLDNHVTIQNQVERYRDEGYPEHNGLIESQIIVTRNTEKTREFFDLWFDELSNNSIRDQISMNYCLWKCGLKWSVLPRDVAKKHKHLIPTSCMT